MQPLPADEAMSIAELVKVRTVATKLILLAGIVLLAVACLAIAAIHYSRSTGLAAGRVYDEGVVKLLRATRLAVTLEHHRRIVESAPAEVDRAVLASARKDLVRLDGRLLGETAMNTADNGLHAPDLSIAYADVRRLIEVGQQTLTYAEYFALDKAQSSAAEYSRIAAILDARFSDYREQRIAAVDAELGHLADNAKRLMLWIGACVSLIVLLLGPIGHYLLSNVFERLAAMRAVVQDLSNHRIDVAIPCTADGDEVGELARALEHFKANAIALIETEQRLATRNDELSRLSASLERRVTERTMEATCAVAAAEEANDLLMQQIEQKTRAEADLRAANEKLLAATRAKMQFLANMSHEIRTPMNGVLGMGDLLLRTPLENRQRHLAQTMLLSAKMLLVVIDDILDLSRIESGKVVVEVKPFALDQCLDDVTGTICLSAHAKSLDFDVIIEPDVPLDMVGDVVRLRQILLNLVGNAIKFTAEGEVIVHVGVTTGEDGRSLVRFEVRDTGIGIDKQQQARLFQPFSQADASINRQFGGTGLGLAISKKLVELMGGTVGLDSEVGTGSTFYFALPLGEAAAATSEQSPAPLVGRLVAVVAAKASKRRALGSHLARLGAQVTLYASIEAVRQRTIAGATTTAVEPDAIVVDASSRADYPLVAAALALPRNAANAKLFIIAPIGSDMHIASASDIPDTLVISRPSLRAEVISALATPPAADGQAELQTTPTANGYGNGNGSSDQLHGLSILVAEDNPVNQEIVREDLIALGCDDLVVVENGIEALAACEQRTFDIILMDCQMPKMDGLRATREIRALETRDGRRQTPIIAVTANAFSSDRQDCSDSGMTGFLCKPFRQSDLSTALREAIEFRRTSRRDAAGVKLDTKRPASQTGDAPLATAMAS